MTDPKVVHPATQNWIDFRNHTLDGPADSQSEDIPALFKKRCPLLQLGRIVWLICPGKLRSAMQPALALCTPALSEV
jgi:hypothetical protein